jgi:hypothetical protein
MCSLELTFRQKDNELQPEQLPFPLDVTAPGPSQLPGEGGQPSEEHINGICCK